MTSATPLRKSRATSEGYLHAELPYTFGTEGNDSTQLGVSFAASDWTGSNVIDDSGLYWWWDPTWDDPYTNAYIP